MTDKPRSRSRTSQTTKSVTSSPAAFLEGVIQEDKSIMIKHRFEFFLIDSGWKSPVSEAVRDNIHMITRFQHEDPLYILSKDQSTSLLRRHPHLIGKDPILLARDIDARDNKHPNENYHGFHYNMGLIGKPDKAIEGLRVFLHFLAMHRDSANIEIEIKDKLHRQTLEGAIEVLRGGAEGLV